MRLLLLIVVALAAAPAAFADGNLTPGPAAVAACQAEAAQLGKDAFVAKSEAKKLGGKDGAKYLVACLKRLKDTKH
jgi:hypothetical protein